MLDHVSSYHFKLYRTALIVSLNYWILLCSRLPCVSVLKEHFFLMYLLVSNLNIKILFFKLQWLKSIEVNINRIDFSSIMLLVIESKILLSCVYGWIISMYLYISAWYFLPGIPKFCDFFFEILISFGEFIEVTILMFLEYTGHTEIY